MQIEVKETCVNLERRMYISIRSWGSKLFNRSFVSEIFERKDFKS